MARVCMACVLSKRILVTQGRVHRAWCMVHCVYTYVLHTQWSFRYLVNAFRDRTLLYTRSETWSTFAFAALSRYRLNVVVAASRTAKQ